MTDLTIICDTREATVTRELDLMKPHLLKSGLDLYVRVEELDKGDFIIENTGPLDLTLEVEPLDVGDFVVSEALCIERKRGDDWVASMLDHRLDDEFRRLKKTYEKPICILEDFERGFNNKHTRVGATSIYGALAKWNKYGIQFLPTRKAKDTANLLVRLAYREQKEEGREIYVRHCPKMATLEERQLNFIQGMLDTGPELAHRLLVYFGGIPVEIFNELAATEFTEKGTFKRKENDEWPEWKNIKGIGPKWVKKNLELLWGKDY